MVDPNGKEIKSFETKWAVDGRSVELNKQDEYTAGDYSLEIASDNAGISPTGNKKEFTVAQRILQRIDLQLIHREIQYQKVRE